MHFARDNYYPDVSVSKAGNGLLETLNKGSQEEIVKLLEVFRQYDKIT